MSWPVLIFHFIQVSFQYDESRKVLELRPNQDVDVTVKECFSLDNEACLICQKYDEDWGEFINVSIQDIQHKDKIKAAYLYM